MSTEAQRVHQRFGFKCPRNLKRYYDNLDVGTLNVPQTTGKDNENSIRSNKGGKSLMHKQFFDHEREVSDDEFEANENDEVLSTTYSDGATQHLEQSRPNAENDDDNEELEDSEEEDAEVRHAAIPPAKKQRRKYNLTKERKQLTPEEKNAAQAKRRETLAKNKQKVVEYDQMFDKRAKFHKELETLQTTYDQLVEANLKSEAEFSRLQHIRKELVQKIAANKERIANQ